MARNTKQCILIISPLVEQKGDATPSSVASIELDAVTATPLLADVSITTTAGQLLSEFF